MSLEDFKISNIPEDKSQIKEWLKSNLDKFVTTLRTSAFNIDEYESFLKDVSSDITDSILDKKETKSSDKLYCGSKKYFLECIADPWIYKSIGDFIENVSNHGLINDDGSCCGVAIDKKTLQLREISIDLHDFDFSYSDPENKISWNKRVEQLIEKYSTDEYQLLGIEWFNK